MESSWLVQRLKKPRSFSVAGVEVDNPFSFGGGLRNGALSPEAMGLLREIFSFDYMGAAEFEWGAVPKALQVIAKNTEDYHAFEFSWPLADVARHWKDESRKDPTGDATVYVICHRAWDEEVRGRIREWAGPVRGERVRLKEPPMLASALRPHDEWDGDRCGWLELDNGFFFFTDREKWESTARLFGIEERSRPLDV